MTSTLAIKHFVSSDNADESRLSESLAKLLSDYHSLVEIPQEVIGNPHSYSGLPVFKTNPQAKSPNTPWEPPQLKDLILGTHGFDERQLGTSARSSDRIQTNYEVFLGADADAAKFSALPTQKRLVRIRPRGEVSTDSNIAFTLLGHLVELASASAPFAQIIREKLFTPLRMTAAKFNFDDSYFTDDNFIMPRYPFNYQKGQGKQEIRENIQFGQYLNMAPALGMYGSTEDVGRFLRMLLRGGMADDGTTRVLTQDQANILMRVAFRNGGNVKADVGNAPPGVTLGGWQEGIYNSVSYLYRLSTMDPYYSIAVLFPQNDIGFTIQSTAAPEAAQILKDLVHDFINVHIKPFSCAGSLDLRFDPDTNSCYKIVKMSNLGAIPNSYKFNGCFSYQKYEHTTWYKIQHLFMPYFCTSAVKDAQTITVSEAVTYQLALDEKDILRRGRINGKNFEFHYPYQEAYGFKLNTADEDAESGKARYFFIDHDVHENISVLPYVWQIFFIIYFSTVVCCIAVIFCCCGNCLMCEGAMVFKQERAKHAYHALYAGEEEWIFEDDEENYLDPYQEEKEDEKNVDEIEQSGDEGDHYDDDIHEVQLPDPSYNSHAVSPTRRKTKLPNLGSKSRFALAGTMDIIAVGSVTVTGVLLILHALGMILSIYAVNPLKLYSQQGVSGLEFWLILPPICLGTTIISLLCFCCVSFNRLFMKPSVNGCVWIIMMAFCVILFAGYVPISAFWNWFGFSYSN